MNPCRFVYESHLFIITSMCTSVKCKSGPNGRPSDGSGNTPEISALTSRKREFQLPLRPFGPWPDFQRPTVIGGRLAILAKLAVDRSQVVPGGVIRINREQPAERLFGVWPPGLRSAALWPSGYLFPDGLKATRKPTSLSLERCSLPHHFAEWQALPMLFQLPPRITRHWYWFVRVFSSGSRPPGIFS